MCFAARVSPPPLPTQIGLFIGNQAPVGKQSSAHDVGTVGVQNEKPFRAAKDVRVPMLLHLAVPEVAALSGHLSSGTSLPVAHLRTVVLSCVSMAAVVNI